MRNPDGTANPYYAYAALLMAGLTESGIRSILTERWGPYDFNLYHLTEEEKENQRPAEITEKRWTLLNRITRYLTEAYSRSG
ncbi:MAG: hypothetical protein ACLS70_05290 [[Clostridium] symbiosum]